MRNLKRALSLALASVMLMGMMVVGSSAKGLEDFSDSAEITNTDAVAVTSAIGIFEGYDDGEFKGDVTVTRAQMAVIIAKMLYGADVKVDQFAEIDTFTDVPAWAEGYVNLVASLGIVAGRGNGIFDPNATVTTAEAAMMLTKALGYFQNAKDFGNNWELAATAKATELGLYGDLKLAAKAGLSREDVAVMVFNALTKAVPVQYNELLGVYYNENQGIIYALEFNYLQTLGYENFDLVYKTEENTIYGRPATTWGFGTYNVKTAAGTTTKTDVLTEAGGLITDKVRMLDSDEIITIPMTPDYVYTTGTKEKDVYKDLGKTVCEDYTWTYFINGEEVEGAEPAKNVTTNYAFTGKGTVTEIYIDDYANDGDGAVTLVEINYYLGEVTSVKKDYSNIKALSDEPKLDDKTFATTEYAEEDYVVFTVDFNDDEEFYIAELMAPATVTGKINRVQNNVNSDNAYVRIDDVKYEYSAPKTHNCFDLVDGKLVHPELNEEYTLYMDPKGYVLGYELVDESTVEYLYVVDADEEMGDWEAKVVLADGTETKIVLKNDYVKMEDGSKTYIAWEGGDGVQDVKVKTNIENHIFAYTVNDKDEYTLSEAAHVCYGEEECDTDKTSGADIHNGKAYIEVGEDEIIVDMDTIFVDVDEETAYVGYKAVPDVDDATIAYSKDGRVAEIVFILSGEKYNENDVYFMLTSQDRESLNKDEDFWEYFDAYINGSKESVIVAYDALEGAAGVVLEEGVLYQALRSNDDGYFTKIQVVEPTLETVAEVANGAFWTTGIEDDEFKYDCDNDTVFVTVEYDIEDDEYDIDEGKLSDMIEGINDEGLMTLVAVVEDDDQYAELVYIFVFDAPPMIESITVKGVEAEYADGNWTVEITTEENEAAEERIVVATADDSDEVAFEFNGAAWDYADLDDPFANSNIEFTVTVSDGIWEDLEFTLTITVVEPQA